MGGWLENEFLKKTPSPKFGLESQLGTSDLEFVKNKPNPSTINTKPSINGTNSLSIYNTITTIRLKPLDNGTKPNIAINIAMLWGYPQIFRNMHHWVGRPAGLLDGEAGNRTSTALLGLESGLSLAITHPDGVAVK